MKRLIIFSFFAAASFSAQSQFSLGFGGGAPKDTAKKVPPDPRSVIKPYSSVITPEYITKKGLFTVHQCKDTVYLEISDSIMHRDIEVINRLKNGSSGSGVYAGEELSEKTIQFEKNVIDSSIRVRYIVVYGQADNNSDIQKAVERSYSNPVAISFPIKAYGEGNKSYVIDITQYLKAGTSFFNDVDNDGMGKYTDVKSAKDFLVESIKAFPLNVEITISKNGVTKGGGITIGGAGGSGLPPLPAGHPTTLITHTSFILLPEKPMAQRGLDPRVGFFADGVYHFGDHQQKSELRGFIVKWRVEPRDEDIERWKRGELVDAKKPIVFYIDPATPKQWRSYLIAGINDWQKAFEQAGFKNAIFGKEWPEGDSTMDMEDARYSFVNYFPSEIQNAYGPQVHDPRSGEIIQSHIGWYHNVMKLLHTWYFVQAAATDPKARKAKFDEELMGQLIRFVSSHEVGHTLGLRHNFGSSSQTPVDSLRSKTYLDQHGHTASIMDYARFNYVAQPEDNIPQYDLFPRIGEYDKWAIEWAYKNSNASTFEEDQQFMRKLVADRTSKNPRLWFGDGEEKKFDPRCQTEDLGDNPMKASAYGIKNLQRIMANLPEWAHEDGGIYANMEEMYLGIKAQYMRYITHVVKYIGGSYGTIKSEDYGGEVYAPVSAAMQKEALSFYDKQIFTTPSWLLDPKVVTMTTVPGITDFIEDLQGKTLNSLFDTERMKKILANQRQFKEKTISLDEYIKEIHKSIWKELASGNVTDPYRRGLQKAYFGNLQGVLLANEPEITENDFYTLFRADILKLKTEIDQAVPKATDTMSKLHLKDLQARIKKTLDATHRD